VTWTSEHDKAYDRRTHGCQCACGTPLRLPLWAGRYFRPALRAAGITDRVRVYDLRHSACSLMIASGLNVIEVAKRMGHSPSMTLDVYGHVFDEYEGQGPVDVEDEIRRAWRAA
jgi:integrase